MIASFDEIAALAELCFDTALEGASTIRFSLNESRAEHYTKSAKLRAAMIGNTPGYSLIDTCYGIGAWSVMLSVDLRQSTYIAKNYGAKATYLTMHTYLPTMVALVNKAQGIPVGLRGDGLFAAFGTTRYEEGQSTIVARAVAEKAIVKATDCGHAMLQAISEIINPLLRKNGLFSDLQICVGISVGDVVITRIGLDDATEITAYGDPVNQACKLTAKRADVVVLDHDAEKLFPTSSGGTMRFLPSGGDYIAQFPPNKVELVKLPPAPKKLEGITSDAATR